MALIFKIKILKYSVFLPFLFYSCSLFAQELITKKDIVYGNAVNFRNKAEDLRLDMVYSIKGKKLPLIVYLHGGGFMESASKTAHLSFCEGIAKTGFAVANVEYRGGFVLSLSNYKEEVSKAVYRAEQDQRAAIRFLVHHAKEYNIDPSLIFIAGESAGGVTSLFSAYVSQDDWDHAAPSYHQDLGSIDNTGNDLTDKFVIKAVVSLWGGIADTSFISSGEMHQIPALFFHSVSDSEIPYERSRNPKAVQQLLLGSKDIATRFKNNNGCYRLHFVKDAGHAYGFSFNYISNAITEFVAEIQSNKCMTEEIENLSPNIALSFMDTDDAAFLNEEDKIIKLSADSLQQYAGTYEGLSLTVTIKVVDDHLTAQAREGDVHELYPLGNNMFLNKKRNIRVEFVKDTEGKVIEHIVRRTRYKEDHFKKIG